MSKPVLPDHPKQYEEERGGDQVTEKVKQVNVRPDFEKIGSIHMVFSY
jgi:hypothetical protein